MRVSQSPNVGAIIVGEKNIADNASSGRKEKFVIDFEVSVKPSARALPVRSKHRVGWIDEVHRPFIAGLPSHFLNPIALDKRNALANCSDGAYAPREGFRVPARKDALAVLADFNETRSLGKNAAVKGSVL